MHIFTQAPALGSQDVARLFREYGPLIYRRALRLLGDAADAEEALQDVFLKVLGQPGRFEDQGRTLNWLYLITTNHCLNRLRGRKRRRAMQDAWRAEPQRQGAAHPVDLTTLRMLLAEADVRQAEAAMYVHVDQMSYSEAAELLGVSKRTVGNLIERFDAWAARRLEVRP
jgi:RNA polymerase sigma-70 factor, ECF subfamily